MALGTQLTPDLAERNPDAFKQGIVEYMGGTTELGALAWNMAIDRATVRPNQFVLNSAGWVSFSKPTGYLKLGTRPMTAEEAGRYHFGGENLSYPDQVTLRLLHELSHGGLFLAQRASSTLDLRLVAKEIRLQSPRHGLSAIGSLSTNGLLYYENPDDQAIEDTTDLAAMRMRSAAYLTRYLEFLASPHYSGIRAKNGLTGIDSADHLNRLVNGAVDEMLAYGR